MRRCFAILIAILPGCFPLEIDVNAQGDLLIVREEGFFVYNPTTKKVNAITGPGGDAAEFGRFSPDGKSILAITKSEADSDYHFHIVAIADGSSKEIYKTDNCNYARFSPDGKSIAVARASGRERKQIIDGKPVNVTHTVCEIAVVDVTTGAVRRLREATILPTFRWFADGKRLLAVVCEGKHESSGRYFGHLCDVDVSSGKMIKIASVLSGDSEFVMDLSPDNRKALLIADGVGAVGAFPKDDGTWGGTRRVPVTEVDLTAKTSRRFGSESPFAVYSPDGRHVLMAERDANTVVVTDADGKNKKTIANDAWIDSFTLLSQMAVTPVVFGWRDNDTVFYFAKRAVYGSSRHSPWLKCVRLKDGSTEFWQPYLDRAVVEALPTIRNPKTGNFTRSQRMSQKDE